MIDHDQKLFIVGMMGAGKSAVGRLLATRLRRPFIDTDQEIRDRTGVSIATIFEVEGEAGFRRREEQVIDELSRRDDAIVLATGGGAILSPLTRARFRERGFTVYLQARAHELWLRTRHDRNRPLLDCDDPKAKLEELLVVRDPLYREVADLVIETGRPSMTRVVDVLVERLTPRVDASSAAAAGPYADSGASS
jgi:shikimate kinase